MPALVRLTDRDRRGGHLIVCGDGALAHRITDELTSRFGERVTVILPSRRRNHGPQIAALDRVTILEYPELSTEAFRHAQVQFARGLAVVWQDDVENFHAGLRATELNPALRLVLAIFNRRLGDHIRLLFPDCTVLSGTAMAAPAFVAAALGEPAPSHVRLQGRTLFIGKAGEVESGQVLCAVAGFTADQTPRLLPPDAPGAELVMAVADGTPRNPLTRRRDPLRDVIGGVLRRLVLGRYGMIFAVLLAGIAAGFGLIWTRYSLSNAAYLSLMDLTGSALTGPSLSGAEKTSQVLLTLDGMTIIPVVTAIVVGARITGTVRRPPRPPGGHVIVAGLGNVGASVIGQLHDLGFDVVCIDRNADASGVPLARALGQMVVIGDAFREQTLRAAGLDTCLALVSVTSSDVVNLETALHARALREDVRIVLRVADDDLAERLEKTIGNMVSRSVSYLAAPAFAAALLEHRVLRTIAVGRHVLLIADIEVGSQEGLAGSTVSATEQEGQARVLALQRSGAPGLNWHPRGDHPLAAGDRLIVLATRQGLSRFIA